MESELRSLIGKYGMRAVHEGLMKEMRDTFQYLQNVFPMKNEIVNHYSVPTIQFANDIIPETFYPHPEEDSVIENDSLSGDVVEVPIDPDVKQVIIKNPKAMNSKPESPAEVKQQKQTHRDEVEKKKQELVAKGIKPETLLTEANLKKWIGEGRSYMKIAKETGVHEIQVSNLAKSFGLQSKISKYVAMKKST